MNEKTMKKKNYRELKCCDKKKIIVRNMKNKIFRKKLRKKKKMNGPRFNASRAVPSLTDQVTSLSKTASPDIQ